MAVRFHKFGFISVPGMALRREDRRVNINYYKKMADGFV